LVSLSLFEAARAGRMPIAACRRQAAAIGRHRIAGYEGPRFLNRPHTRLRTERRKQAIPAARIWSLRDDLIESAVPQLLRCDIRRDGGGAGTRPFTL
jgi:hypothetical protein